MPHTLYLGSGLVQARMREFDRDQNTLHEVKASDSKFAISLYRPTLSTIKACMSVHRPLHRSRVRQLRSLDRGWSSIYPR